MAYQALMKQHGAVYLIRSYNTPIAWLDARGEWTIPDVKYSVTTSRHQGKIRTAISQLPGAVELAQVVTPNGHRNGFSVTYVPMHDSRREAEE
jgi:hypothetical protein